jgi:hypothetical protein
MIKLNDTQLILLSAASQRGCGSLLPLPETLADAGDRAGKAITLLLKRGLAEEREINDAGSIHRSDGDLRYGVFITDAGNTAIDTGPVDVGELVSPAPPLLPARPSKTATVIALLERADGATLGELIAVTDWLPHTTRAALTGLRKSGRAIARFKRDDATCYRITPGA